MKDFFKDLKNNIKDENPPIGDENTAALISSGFSTSTIMLLFLANGAGLGFMVPDILKDTLIIPIYPAIWFLFGIISSILTSHFSAVSAYKHKHRLYARLMYLSNMIGTSSFLCFCCGISLVLSYKCLFIFGIILNLLSMFVFLIVVCLILVIISLFT